MNGSATCPDCGHKHSTWEDCPPGTVRQSPWTDPRANIDSSRTERD
jgi:hypothetical protein